MDKTGEERWVYSHLPVQNHIIWKEIEMFKLVLTHHFKAAIIWREIIWCLNLFSHNFKDRSCEGTWKTHLPTHSSICTDDLSVQILHKKTQACITQPWYGPIPKRSLMEHEKKPVSAQTWGHSSYLSMPQQCRMKYMDHANNVRAQTIWDNAVHNRW